MSHEATIRNLDQEQSRLKEKISRLEEEREALLNQSQAANEQHKQQVIKLEQVPNPPPHVAPCPASNWETVSRDKISPDFSSCQSLREEHQGHEKELTRLRAHYEEEMLRFREAQVRALEEMEEKHQAMTEEAQQEKEEEKKLLVTVGLLYLNMVQPFCPTLGLFSLIQTKVMGVKPPHDLNIGTTKRGGLIHYFINMTGVSFTVTT